MNYRHEIEMGKKCLTTEQQAYIDGMSAVVNGVGVGSQSDAYVQIFLKMIMFKEMNKKTIRDHLQME